MLLLLRCGAVGIFLSMLFGLPALAECTTSTSDQSSTCWKPIEIEPYAKATIEVSRQSIPMIERFMLPSFEAGRLVLDRIDDLMESEGPDSVGIYVTIDANKRHRANDDCAVYEISPNGSLDNVLLQDMSYDRDCTNAVTHLLRAVTSVEDFVYHAERDSSLRLDELNELDWGTLSRLGQEIQFVKSALAQSFHGEPVWTERQLQEISELSGEDPDRGMFYSGIYLGGVGYVVDPNDTLWGIAEGFTGDGNNFGEIRYARVAGNLSGTQAIENPDEILRAITLEYRLSQPAGRHTR